MKLHVVGTNNAVGDDYYLRHEFDIEKALDDGFRIFKGGDGYYYGTPGGTCEWRSWTARRVKQTTPDASEES